MRMHEAAPLHGATPADGIIFRELLDGATLAEIADRYECEERLLRERVADRRERWRNSPPRFLRPAPGKLIIPVGRWRGGKPVRDEMSVPAVTMHARHIEEQS